MSVTRPTPPGRPQRIVANRKQLEGGRSRRIIVCLAFAAGAAAFAGQASAANWTVWAGPSGLLKKPPPGVPKTTEPDIFLPAALQIHAGDSVTVQTKEGHTVASLGPKKASDFHFFAGDAKHTTYSATDFAGDPFWFRIRG